MNDSLEQILNSSAWEEVESIFKKQIEILRKQDIDWNVDNDTAIREVRSRIIAANILEQTLNHIKLEGKPLNTNNIIYK